MKNNIITFPRSKRLMRQQALERIYRDYEINYLIGG